MGLENARENMESGLNGETTPTETPSADLAPGSMDSSDTQDAAPRETQALTAQEVIDLDKLEKFKLHGEEWTRDKLASAMLRQADYTRKTQEFSKERKFYENLYFDLRNLEKNPALIEQFKKIYPNKFHEQAEQLVGGLQTKPSDGKVDAKTGADPQLLARLNEVEGKFRQQEVQAASVMLDSLFKQNTAKYPYADEASVISKSLALMEQKTRNGDSDELSKDEWDRIFKSENDRVQKLAEAQYKATVQKQLTANRKAKDVGRGGDAVGQAPKRMTMKEATAKAISDAEAGMLGG